jgi:peptidyl-prolyl cis-trans isomerase C
MPIMSQLRASHLLVETEKEAQELKNKIATGLLTFEDAAKESSSCPSGQSGGDLGWFGMGMMVKPFEDACFELAESEVSDPVKTQFGWHLIKLTGKK